MLFVVYKIMLISILEQSDVPSENIKEFISNDYDVVHLVGYLDNVDLDTLQFLIRVMENPNNDGES